MFQIITNKWLGQTDNFSLRSAPCERVRLVVGDGQCLERPSWIARSLNASRLQHSLFWSLWWAVLMVIGAGCDSTIAPRPAEDGSATDGGVRPEAGWPDLAANESERFCPSSTGCWEAPLPQGNQLNGLWGTAPDNVYAVGAAGTILRFDGQSWRSMPVKTSTILTAVWGSSEKDIWAIGPRLAVLHYDGSEWKIVYQPTLGKLTIRGIWGSGPEDVFFFGSAATIVHFNGSSWEEIHLPKDPADTEAIEAMWGSSATDIWAVSYRKVWHFDGVSWSAVVLSADEPSGFNGIWGSGKNDVFLHGQTVWHFDGSKWTEQQVTEEFSSAGAIWGRSPQEVYGVRHDGLNYQVWRYDGEQWQVLPDPPLVAVPPSSMRLNAIWDAGPGAIHVIGDGGTILRFDQASGWTAVVTLQGGTVTCLWGSGAEEVYAGRLGGEVLRRGAAGWSSTNFPGTEDVEGLWGSGPSAVYAGSGGAIWRFDGSAWTKLPGYLAAESRFQGGLWGRAEGEIYAGASIQHGDSEPDTFAILRYDGAAWQMVKEFDSCSIKALWGSVSGKDLFAASTCGLILFDGAKWIEYNHAVVTATGFVDALWGDSATNVYAAGARDQGREGMIWHYNGEEWQEMQIPAAGHLLALWGQHAGEIYAAGWASDGTRSVILRFDGKTWSELQSSIHPILSALWGDGAAHLFAGGTYGAILHRGP